MMNLQTMQTAFSSVRRNISFYGTRYTNKGQGILESNSSEHTASTEEELSETDEEITFEEDDELQPRVRFVATGTQAVIDSHLDYSDEERQNCWYSTNENEMMLTSVRWVVARMEAGEPEMACSPYRGLEKWLAKNKKAVVQHTRQAISAILDEEEKQWNKGGGEGELAIAHISEKLTACSVEKALRIAREDEKEAIAIHDTKDE